MTCIVGLSTDDAIWIGGDSAGTDRNFSIQSRADAKVFGVDNNIDTFLFGIAGSFRIGQILRYGFVPPIQVQETDDMQYVVTDFLDSFRIVCNEKGALVVDSNQQQTDGSFVMAYRDKLYVVYEDLQVACVHENYVAIGSGSDIALGCLYGTQNSKMSPHDRITLALDAAEQYNAGCRAPYNIAYIKKLQVQPTKKAPKKTSKHSSKKK